MSVIRKPHELKVQPYIKVLLYGQPGLRKTTFALSAPAPLLIDTDRGVHRIDPRHQVDTVQVESWEDIETLLKDENLDAYKTLVIDTAGKLLDFMTNHIIKQDPKMAKRDGALQLQGYGARKVMFTNFLRTVADKKKHLVFVAHEKEEKDGDQKILRPEIGGSSSGDLIKELDLVGYMQSVGDIKTISFEPCERFYAKNTCKLPKMIELVNTIEDNKQNTQLTAIFQNFTNSLEERQKMSVAYQELMEVINAKVHDAISSDLINEVADWANNYPSHIWDSKLQAAYGIRNQAKTLGLTFNRDLKKYVPLPAKAAETSGQGQPAANAPVQVTQSMVGEQVKAEAAKAEENENSEVTATNETAASNEALNAPQQEPATETSKPLKTKANAKSKQSEPA